MTRLRQLNPLRLLAKNFSYQPLSSAPGNGSDEAWTRSQPWPWGSSPQRRWGWRVSVTKLLCLLIAALVLLSILVGGGRLSTARRKRLEEQRLRHAQQDASPGGGFFWQQYRPLRSFYNGVRTLTPADKHEPENAYNASASPLEQLTVEQTLALPHSPPLDPVRYDPYPDYTSSAYTRIHAAPQPCFLDADEKVRPPDVYAYPGLPLGIPDPFFGSYAELGMRDDVCFDRFGRLGPYGFGYEEGYNALQSGKRLEHAGSEKVFERVGFMDYRDMDWGTAQKRCHEKNRARFEAQQAGRKKRVKKHAYVLRTWAGYQYTPMQMHSLRAMVSELSLKSGGEYDVHFLVHVKDNSIPIWADEETYRTTLEENVPREFWNVSTLWSEQQMKMYYPSPFGANFADMVESNVHGVYRSAHFALQWFSQQHPEYDFFWNWEMDLRFSGHYYELHNSVGEWAKRQPRKGLWERSKRFWLPKHHGNYQNFTKFVEQETREVDAGQADPQTNGPVPVWGAVRDFENAGPLPPPDEVKPPTTYERDEYKWGVGEDADFISFNPIFDPSTTNWVFRRDVTGYDRSKHIPPRRAAIITVARLSRRLLNTMHAETWRAKHTMFPEMWPATVCLHHGLKAVYAPHPVYFDRDWDLGYLHQQLNYPAEPHMSPFGWGENNLLGSTFYYNSAFAAKIWRRWLGLKEDGEGGARVEREGTGRMCIRPILHHPVKREDGEMD